MLSSPRPPKHPQTTPKSANGRGSAGFAVKITVDNNAAGTGNAGTPAAGAAPSLQPVTTPYSGHPDPRRTLTPVDLDATPPPDTPVSTRSAATQSSQFDSFGFPAAAATPRSANSTTLLLTAEAQQQAASNANPNDPFLDLTVDDDGFVTSGFPAASRKSPGPSAGPGVDNRVSPLPPKPTANGNTDSLLSSAKKKKSLQKKLTPNKSQSIHRTPPPTSSGASVASASSKAIGQLAVDSNCVAGEFREIVVTLSENSTFDDDDDNNDQKKKSDKLAFGLDPNDVSMLENDSDDLDDQHRQQMQRNANHANRSNGNDDHEFDADFGQQPPAAAADRTPPRHPHGPREGAEQYVVLSESQKKLRDKLLRSGGSAASGTPATAGSHRRLDQHFARSSPFASNASPGVPRPHDRSVLGGQNVNGIPRSISTTNLEEQDGRGYHHDDANSPSNASAISGVTNFTESGFPQGQQQFGGQGQGQPGQQPLPPHVYRSDADGPPLEPGAQYRGTWMIGAHHTHGDAHGIEREYTTSYLDKPSGIVGTGSPAAIIADRRMAAAMRAAGHGVAPQTVTTGSPARPQSAPRSRSSSSPSRPTAADDDVMRNVANRVKTSMKLGGAGSSPLPPRPRSVSPKPGRSAASGAAGAAAVAPSVQLRHREHNGSPTAAAAAAANANGSSIVFGAPDTFGEESGDSHTPSIKDRAKALNDWMGGKGVKIEREVRPTAGYTNDTMYQNAYSRRTSPQVIGSKKTIGDARASLTPPKTRPAPNSGTFAYGSAGKSSFASSSNGSAGGSAAKSRNPPAFLAKFEGNGASSPDRDTSNDDGGNEGGSAAKSKKVPAFLAKFEGNGFSEEVAAAPSDQGTTSSTSISPASLKENAMPPQPTTSSAAKPSTVKAFGTDNNTSAADDMAFLRSWGKSRGKQQPVQTPTGSAGGGDDNSFPDSPKFNDDGFGDVVSMNGKVQAGAAWGMENASGDDDAWANADDFGEPFYS
jgi:hypothetical protein